MPADKAARGKTRLAVLGGTFDPPHLGHIRLLRAAGEAFSADRLCLMPDRVPPHKAGGPVAGRDARLQMCRLCAELLGAEVSTLELDREGRSYTADTLEALHRQGDCCIGLVMGGDMLLTLPQWYRYPRILQLAHILAVMREEDARFWAAARQVEADGGCITAFSLPPDGISSSLVRERAAAGQSIDDLVPPAVSAYIRAHRLYGTPGGDADQETV